jgi:pyruvate/2-oxoglutarate dehydrogenase complex dihydrolipoamide dehydrogenase (E3) component
MIGYDAIVIGLGTGGEYLATRFANAGLRVAAVERDLFGGTCLNVGCTPTKALVASAYAAHLARRGAEYGVAIDGRVAVDMKQVKARKDAIIAPREAGVEKWLRGTKNCTVYHDQARFISPREVKVGNELLTAEKIFISVGGRAAAPPLKGLESVDYFTNVSMLDIDFLPPHLLIIGGSYIGLEFAQMYRRFGSEVTVIEMAPRLIPREDEDVSGAIRDILEKEGVHVRLDAKCIEVGKRGNEITAGVDCTGGPPAVTGTHLLLATGRRPNTDNLGLEHTGVQLDGRGYIVVDDQLRTNVPGIWAVGDCNGRGAFTHTAFNDFEIVAANLLDNDPRKVTDRIVAYALFIDPPLGRVGLTEAEVRKLGRPALIGRRAMASVARAVEKGETQGFMKILIDAASKEILGASILGMGGDEAVHEILDLMYAKAPYTVMQRAVHIHPTVSELIPTMLGELKPLET